MTGSRFAQLVRSWMAHDRAPALCLAAIVALGAALRLAAIHGFKGSDDRAYAELAHALATGAYPPFDEAAAVFQNRIGLIAPVALFVRIFGDAEWVFLIVPFMLSLASIGLAFGFGRALFGTAAGLVAAAITAVLPIEMQMATQLVPDPAAAFFVNLGIFALWRAGQSASARDASWFGGAAGLCFGIAWLFKVTIAYAGPFAIAFFAFTWRRRPEIGRSAFAATTIAAGAILVLEAASYAVLSGDPLFRFHSLSRNFEQTQLYWFVEGGRFGWQPGGYAAALAERLFVRGPERIFLSRAYAHLPLCGLLVCVLALRTREARFAFCGVWFGSLLLLFNFGTTSLEYYKPLVLFQRYLYPLVLPATLLTAGALVLSIRRGALRSWPLRVPRAAIVALLCLPLARGIVAGLDREFERETFLKGVREVAARYEPDQPLVTDRDTRRDLDLFWGFPEQHRTSAFDENPAAIAPGTRVFVNRERLRRTSELMARPEPRFLHDLPEHWELERRVAGGEIYVVGRKSDTLSQR